jgi:hypothetical protein
VTLERTHASSQAALPVERLGTKPWAHAWKALVLGLSMFCIPALAQTSSQAMFVKFEIPRRQAMLVTITYEEALRLTRSKQPYTIGFWIEGALLKSKLHYTITKRSGRDWVSEIGGVRESAKGKWVTFVDGERLEIHMNTQPAEGAHSIRLVYETG